MISWQIQQFLAAHFRRQLSLSLFFLCRHGNICLTQHFANNSFCFGTLDTKELWHWFSFILGALSPFFLLYWISFKQEGFCQHYHFYPSVCLCSFCQPFVSMSACFYVSLFVFSPVCVLHLPGHHGEELGEVDRAVAVGVHLSDNVEESLSLFNVWSCWWGWWWCGDRWSWSCPPRWSCPAARPLWGSGPGTSSPATPTSTWIVWTQLKKV